ncbi:Transposon Tn7 transposition protein TnsA [Thiomonas sp. X19]|uniref:TnsA endonuclease N-terminal domain-containing protein n=1 Tax=Thiomonas sp. X19 TaxID=1050370 RepID=UPI000B67FE17|nr:TnsA endonuclease N-terminal domain-containing protein [Thiomonas sp. X19]SCC93382.1 Transposon Tn7 transposition protein TnsA [Thiomonas sp. X19]
MAKRRYGFDEDKIARFLKEGRGQGRGKDYRPWLNVQDVSSRGRSSRIHSRKTGREHHLLSDMETALFLLLDWSDAVTDIREQFPLDRDETRRIAADMGVRHPIDTQSRTDIVMTTDFMINLGAGNTSALVARSVKPASELDEDRTLEKQEIERRYWQIKGVDWGLVTDLDLPAQRIKNLRWLHEMQSLQLMTAPQPSYWDERCGNFLACLPQATGMSIKQFFRLLESTQGFAIGEALTVLRHLAANKRITIDLNAKFDMQMQVDSLEVVVPNTAAQQTRKSA